MELTIRQEYENEYAMTDALIRRAFWNLFMPGCNEHYLSHLLRQSEDYVKAYSLVAILDGQMVGQIMYSRSYIKQGNTTLPTLTFGPLSVDPQYQNQGIGARLIEASVKLAKEAIEKAIIIFGHPDYYHRFGFVACEDYDIQTSNGVKTDAFMVLPLLGPSMDLAGTFYASTVFDKVDNMLEIEKYDQSFPPLIKGEPKFHID